jgi:hypothetical protein
MRWWIYYATDRYEGFTFDSFDNEEKLLELLNKYAPNPDFTFTVIKGDEVRYKPVERVVRYEREGS